MLRARYAGETRIEIDEVDPEPPASHEVQVRVAYVGICGTDLHVLHGDMDARVDIPTVIGHEMSGVIAAVGDAVEGWASGDRVTVMPLSWDGSCPACLAGHQHICQNLTFIGIDSPGALQGYWNVPVDVLVRLPEGLDLKHAALVEPVAVAVHDVKRSQLGPGQKAVVLGGGPIGVLIAVVAKTAGAEVLVVEPDAGRQATVQSAGFRTLSPENMIGAVEEWTGGAGADVVFEVSGAASAILDATSLLRVRGRLVVVAIHSQPRPLDLHRVFWRELTILGTRVYEREDFLQATELLAAGAVPTSVLITRVEPLSQVGDAFDRLAKGQEMKVLVDVQAGQR